jgi:hypothetical protein
VHVTTNFVNQIENREDENVTEITLNQTAESFRLRILLRRVALPPIRGATMRFILS